MRALALVRYPVSVKGRADDGVVGIQERPFARIQSLQVGADDELALGELFPAEIADGFQYVDPKQRLATLEFDFDVGTFQSVEKRKDTSEGFGRPIEPAGRFGSAGNLAIAAGKIAAERRHEDDVVHSRRPRLAPRPPVGERCPVKVELLVEAVISLVQEGLIGGGQVVGGVPVQEAVAGLSRPRSPLATVHLASGRLSTSCFPAPSNSAAGCTRPPMY
ncbi:hypothetical protein BAE39_26895 [Mesorhizobium loti]|uniref:Uncharacterized protein n=1 Tax=Rhizobium loti TaxID=381 RepID=A0A1A5PRP8_RHILI|nr:hypothetical protein BAE39_26895 [Mesorhizobium loti]OBQ57702.1 hypothetical protein A8145_27010 [Mesorhizobium loti]